MGVNKAIQCLCVLCCIIYIFLFCLNGLKDKAQFKLRRMNVAGRNDSFSTERFKIGYY